MSISEVGLDCTGCRACKQVCELGCIGFMENDEGFFYPVLLGEPACVECGLCEKVCPALHEPKHRGQQAVYAAYVKDNQLVRESSSGGMFSALARYVFGKGGIVFGCAFDENMYPRHVAAETNDDLKALRGSKYVESDLGVIYTEVKEFLEGGRYVLFTGTPCQVAGLKNYLDHDYEKLYTADIICHGVPSRKLFANYINWCEFKHRGKVIDFQFRDKDRYGWALAYSYYVRHENGRRTRYQGSGYESPYYYGFLKAFCYHESCYRCKYSTLDRVGDITLGDFWGVKNHLPQSWNPDGVSAVLANSQRGKALLDEIETDIYRDSATLEMIYAKNKNLVRPSPRPPERDTVYKELKKYCFIFLVKYRLKPQEE